MRAEQYEKYEWVSQIEAWTIAIVSGRTVAEVVRIYGGDPDAPLGDYSFEDAEDVQDFETDRYTAQVFATGERVVVIEPNWFSGSLPEIARRCSAGGASFLSYYRNVDADGYVTEAVDGEITARYESLRPIASRQPHEIRPDWAVGPEPELGSGSQVAMALLEQRTGLVVAEDWVTRTLPTYVIPDPFDLYRDVPDANLP